MLKGLQNIHFIGIGGAGMSAIAHVLLKRGYQVSGSDLNAGHMGAKLAQEGALVYMGHAECQVDDVDAVVISSAIHQNNPELMEAKKRNLPILHRSDVLAEILNHADGVAVAGAHGKTTTSAMISCIAAASDIDPTIIIGGEVGSLGGNARNGAGPYVVAEADESDGSFLKFYPKYAIVTNIENDHMDHYGSEENIYLAFTEFLSNVKDGGAAILCMDSPKLRKLASETTTPVISYGLEHEDARYQARNIRYSVNGTCYDLYVEGVFVSTVELIVPGQHNVLNSLGAIATAQAMGIPMQQILPALKKFSGARRRFETKGRIDGIWVVDDYAHHPTEIGVTLKAARQTQPKRLICAFQPHRYTRTKLLFDEFSRCFADCDQLILTDIYSAGEVPIDGVSGASLAEAVTEATQQQVTFIPTLPKLEEYLFKIAEPGDLIMTVGAGDIFKVGEELVTELERGR